MPVKHQYILVTLSITFFLVYSYVPFTTAPKFNIPDQTVNLFFSELYAHSGQLSYSEELNEVAQGIIHPRLTSNINGMIVPQKFVGFPMIAGTIGTVSPEAIRFIVPLLGIICALFLYLIVRDLLNRKVALLSFFLLLFLPPYWYWSTWTMLENVAACAVFIISLRYFFKLLRAGTTWHYVLWGLFLGLAMFIRPDYILFVPALSVILLWNRQRINNIYIGLSAFAFMVALGPLFVLNNHLYGSPLITGQHVKYGLLQVSTVVTFSPLNILENLVNIVDVIPFFFLFVSLGIVYWAKKRLNLQYITFLAICLLTFSFYYLGDRILSASLHSSYLRYSLPILVLLTPVVSYFILSFRSKVVSILLILSLVCLSVVTVLPSIQKNLDSAIAREKINTEIVEATEPSSVILLIYATSDKGIFPERKVGLIRELPSANQIETLGTVSIGLYEKGVPVYIFTEGRSWQLVDYDMLIKQLTANGYTLTESKVKGLYSISKEGYLVNE